MYIELLAKNGSTLSEDIMKHIEDEIWELRPGKNRVLYFFYRKNKYILLHHFIKKTQKTPRREIEKAKIKCAAKHFKAISKGNVKYGVVNSYGKLMDMVMK